MKNVIIVSLFFVYVQGYAMQKTDIVRQADLDLFTQYDTTLVEPSQFCEGVDSTIATVCINEGVAIALYCFKTKEGTVAHINPYQASGQSVDGIIPWQHNSSMLLRRYQNDKNYHLAIHLHTRKNYVLLGKIAGCLKKLSGARITQTINSDRDLLLDMTKGIVFTGQITPQRIQNFFLDHTHDVHGGALLQKVKCAERLDMRIQRSCLLSREMIRSWVTGVQIASNSLD